MLWASTIPTGPDTFSVNFILACLNETGYKRLILKSDNEPAILALKNEVKAQAKDVEIIMQESPTGDHSANGSVEVAVRDEKRKHERCSVSSRRTSTSWRILILC